MTLSLRLTLDSIQVGDAKPSPAGSKPTTAIDKHAIDEVVVNERGLVGDTIADTEHHGGPDQAVYVYFRDDYDYWEDELGFALPGGQFGDNLTISGVSSADVAVGDRFTIRDVVLEATAARIPCGVLSHHMDEANFVDRFRDARRPGVYCRVLSGGVIATGDDVVFEPAGGEVTILDTQDMFYDVRAPTEQLEAALSAPISIRLREMVEGRLARR